MIKTEISLIKTRYMMRKPIIEGRETSTPPTTRQQVAQERREQDKQRKDEKRAAGEARAKNGEYKKGRK